MTKEEYIRILMLLSQLEGYLAGRIDSNVLPDHISEKLSDVCELLSNKIKET